MTTTAIKPKQMMLGLPAERLAQLRAIADHRGTTAVEIVERAIRSAIEAGEIEDSLPGLCEFTVVSVQEMVISVRGEAVPPLNRDQAHLFALLLDAATGRASLPGKEFKLGSALSLPLGAGFQICVGRHVRAVLIALVDGRTGEMTFRTATSASLAGDFARLLRKHAAQMNPPLTQTMPDGSAEPTDLLRRILNTETPMPTAQNHQETMQ